MIVSKYYNLNISEGDDFVIKNCYDNFTIATQLFHLQSLYIWGFAVIGNHILSRVDERDPIIRPTSTRRLVSVCDDKIASHHFLVLPGKVCKARSNAAQGLFTLYLMCNSKGRYTTSGLALTCFKVLLG